MGFMSNKSDTVQLADLRRGLLACFVQGGVIAITIMDSRTINLLTTGSNMHHAVAITLAITLLVTRAIIANCTQIPM